MFDLDLFSIDGKHESFLLKKITLSTDDGYRTILSKHMDLILPLAPGISVMVTETSRERYFMSSGIFYFKTNRAVIIVSSFENENEVDFIRANKAYTTAKQTKEDAKSQFELLKSEQAIKRAIARLKLDE